MAGGGLYGRVRAPFGVRIGLSVEQDRGDVAAARPGLHRTRRRCALSARRKLPHLGRICGLLPDRLGGARARHGAEGPEPVVSAPELPLKRSAIAIEWQRIVLPLGTL